MPQGNLTDGRHGSGWGGGAGLQHRQRYGWDDTDLPGPRPPLPALARVHLQRPAKAAELPWSADEEGALLGDALVVVEFWQTFGTTLGLQHRTDSTGAAAERGATRGTVRGSCTNMAMPLLRRHAGAADTMLAWLLHSSPTAAWTELALALGNVVLDQFSYARPMTLEQLAKAHGRQGRPGPHARRRINVCR